MAQAIGRQLIRAGVTVFYRSTFDAVRDLLHDESFDGHEKAMARYLKPDLLILDDMGMKHLPKRSGEYLFEIIMRRHELKSTLMTSNRPLENWTEVLSSERLTGATLDRLTHRFHILQASRQSYRLREAKRRKQTTDSSRIGAK